MRNALKYLFVVFVIALTYLATSSIMARVKTPVLASPRTPGLMEEAPRLSIKTADEGEAVPRMVLPANHQIVDRPVIASFSLKGFSVATKGADAIVTASIEVTDSRDGMSHIWRLRTFPENESEPIKHAYFNQIFQVDPTRQNSFDFKEIVELTPGAHKVQLALYSFKPGTDLGFLDDDQTAMAYQTLSASERIVINPMK
jgi:hypothetical protein